MKLDNTCQLNSTSWPLHPHITHQCKCKWAVGSILRKQITYHRSSWEDCDHHRWLSQATYRRPGYVVAVESGVSYRHGKHSFSLFVPYNIIKNRIQSAADRVSQNIQNSAITDASQKVHVQGDAAFADYSISVNYGYRLGRLFSKKVQNPFGAVSEPTKK